MGPAHGRRRADDRADRRPRRRHRRADGLPVDRRVPRVHRRLPPRHVVAFATVDWRLYHAIYSLSRHHRPLGTLFSDVEKASIPFMVVATAALRLLARPGGDRKWKLAAGSGFTAAALALLLNLVLHSLWDRPRP